MNENQTTYNLLLILPVALSAIWVLVDLFYTSWLLALIANFLANAFLPKGTGVYIGRLKISLLTGRIIFKDVQYYDRDNSIFITDGYGVLRWWKKEPNIDDSTVKCNRCGSQTKAGVGKRSSLVFLQLNGVEYHWYNRKDIYDEWGKPKIDENENEGGSGLTWIKQLRPSIHCSINKGRILFGNQLTERTLVVYVNHAEGQYRMTEASNSYDELMHVIRWHGDKVRAVLEPSVGYNGPHDEVPHCGEVEAGDHRGYLLLKTDSAEGVYSLDIPGLVPMNDISSPKFALDVFLGRNSVINYGSYANRQRVNLIQKFFFPNDYTVPPVSRIPQPGERRIYTSFDVSVYVLSNATLNLFFEEKQEIRCLTFRVGGDSCLCINQPWITKENGYTTTIKGKATDIEALTSLSYESLGRCQVFEIKTDLFFPRVWNSTQSWDMKLGLSAVQANILFQYIDFFNALIDDWLGDDPPDLLEFIPLDWRIEVDMNDYEVFLHSSPYNWIDITTEGRENTRLAFCGKTGHISFEFPFGEFLPIEQRVSFTARGQNIVVRKYIPPSCSTRDSQFQLSSCCKNRWRLMDPPEDRSPLIEKKLMRSMSQPLEIFDPELLKEKFEGGAKITGDVLKSDSFKRSHIRRGSEPLLTKAQIQTIPLKDMGLLMEDIAEEKTEEEEETELTEKLVKPPIQQPSEPSNEFFPMGYRKETSYEDGWLDIACGPELLIEINYKGHNYDPTIFTDSVDGEERMVPNEVYINVEAPTVLVRVFGSLASDILALRDNFVSEYMYFKTYFSESTSSPDNTREDSQPLDLTRPPDTSTGPNVPTERFLNVFVDFKLRDIMGELPAHLPDNLPANFPLISGMSELFSIHVDYTESETCVHLHVDPITINSPSPSNITGSLDHSLGYLTLSSVDFRCHGFTEYLLKERVEYAWMMKLDLGQIAGTVSAHQLLPAIDFFQTAANHVISSGDDFVKPPDAVVIEPMAEPLSELIKYKLFAVNVSTVNVNIKERDSLLKLKSSGFSLDLCNLHSDVQTLAVSLQLHHVTITSFITPSSNTATTTSCTTLVECGHADVGTIRADVGLREPDEAMATRQLEFLKRADSRSHRLWFIWDDQYSCGCCGGCLFLSSSITRTNKHDVQDSLSDLVINASCSGKEGGGSSSTGTVLLAMPSQFAFKSLKTLHHLHSTLVSYHFSCNRQPQFLRGVSIEDTPTHILPATSLPSINVIQEDESPLDSDNDSFHSAQEYLMDAASEELFHSSYNTPRSSVRQHSRQPSKQSIQTSGSVGGPETSSTHPKSSAGNQKASIPSHYSEVLNSYKCRWRTVKLYWKAGYKETPPIESKVGGSGLRFTGGATPKRGRKSIGPSGPRFVLEVLEFVSAAKRSPYILSSNNNSPSSSSPRMTGAAAGHKQNNTNQEGSAMFSVEIEIGTFDVFLSPPLLRVIDRYIDCADLYFTTRSPHLLLEAVTLDGLTSIQSLVKKIEKTSKMSPPIPSSSTSPLAHLYVSMEPSSHGSIQIVQASNILSSTRKYKNSPVNSKVESSESKSDDHYRTSLVCLYTSGLQGNALVHHNSVIVSSSNCVEKDSSNLQMTLKVAGKFCLPVLQAGMFAINMSPRGEEGKIPSGITRNYSFLDFIIEPSSVLDKKSLSVSVTNVAELSMNKFQLTTAAKIIQSEFSSSPILMWTDIPTDSSSTSTFTQSGDKDERDSEQTNNSILINISVPSVRLQMAGPRHGTPYHNELCVDVSQLYALVEAWKPPVEQLIEVVKVFWRNKIKRDRQLLLSLITSAMDTAYRKKVRNPLLTSLSCSLRESVAYSIIQQLWLGLPLATTDRFTSFPKEYQEGFLLQEIVATLISLALRLHVQRSSLSDVPCVEQHHRHSRPSGDDSTAGGGYFSISPSASELAMLNSSFTKQDHSSVNIDYPQLLTNSHAQSLLFIRETLLPFFLACNVKIAQQLNKQYHNSLKLSMDYHIRLEEAAVLVVDGREDHSSDSVDDSVGVVPEFLLDQLYITGSLEHVKESRVIVQSSGHLVTIRSTSDSNKGRKLRSNITSKCYLGLDTIATHITLPLLMLVRHTSHSVQHWRKSFQYFADPAVTHTEHVNLGERDSITTSRPTHVWPITTKQLVEILSSMEKRKSIPVIKVSSSKQTTPRSSQRNLNVAAVSPNYPLSVKALGAISKAYGLEESDTTTGRRPSIGSSSSRESPPATKITQPPIRANTESITSPADGGLELLQPEDTTDSPHVFSSDAEEGGGVQTSMATYARKTSESKKLPMSTINPVDFVPELSPAVEMPNMNEILAIPDNQLEFSVYGSIRIKSLQVSSEVETLLVMLEVRNISGAIDCRQLPDGNEQGGVHEDHVPLLYKLLPTYLSISSTLQQCCVRVFDSAVSKGDLAVLSINPLELCTSLYYDNKQPAPAYRSLFRLPRVELDMKEPPIILHKKFHKYVPTFTTIFNELFTPSNDSVLDEKRFVPTSTPSTKTVSDLQFPPHLPRGSFLFKLAWFRMIVRPLSTLTVKYELAPVTAQLGTSSVIRFSMNVGQHNLEFTPKESKDELSLRNIPLPTIALKGSIVPRPSSRLPSISAELAMKQVVVNVTTDVFNQLLLLQTSFIKELNDLISMFFNIGESLPQEKISSINLKQSTESGFELISLLSSVKLSLQGIKITVSTPTQTALRFSTGNKIEMLVTNPSHQMIQLDGTNHAAATVDQLTLHGKVETEISVSLGVLQDDPGDDEEDDFVELAYFKTWITVKNTLQQNTSLLAELGEGGGANYPASLDTFLISIMAPHLYIQSTAVEKAILFWVNCKSVYNYWQNEHKLLNAEVQAATEEFMERFKTKQASQIRAPSFDFSKPRLVQISVNDVGACMPLVALPTTPHSSQKGFPAVVFTIKDMQVILNLSKKLGSAGRFSDFCIRFDERFHFRHKTWTVDPKKHKSLNYGVVPNGTYRFSIVNQPNHNHDGGEKLFSSFTWHMSGIHTNSTTLIGRHISTLVRTLTAIGSDLEEPQHQNDITTSSCASPATPANSSPQTVPARLSVKRRYSYSNFEEEDVLRALEVDLAKQTRKLQKLRQSGATPDSLKNEEDNFHRLEAGIARELRKVFRKGRGMSFQQWGQLLYPRSPVPLPPTRKRFGTLPRRKVTFEEPSESSLLPSSFSSHHHPLGSSHSPRTHARHKSDITADMKRLIRKEQEEDLLKEAIPSINLEAVMEDTEKEQEEEHKGETRQKGGVESSGGSKVPTESLIPSIDIEINVNIKVDSGEIILLSEDVSSHDQKTSLGLDSPIIGSRRVKQSGPSVHTVLYIPAIEVKAHYQSILSSTYTTAPPSPIKPLQSSPDKPRSSITATDLSKAPDNRSPVKKGVLSIVTVISSLDDDLKLNPSILDFIEQVVRPINISAQEIETAAAASSAEFDTEDEKELDDDASEFPMVVKKSDGYPLSFPVDVSLNFQILPSKIILTCNPHARVQCQIVIPTVSFMVSFSLFSKRQYDNPLSILPSSNETTNLSQSPPNSSVTLNNTMDDNISAINNINVTGCLQTFQLTMFTPNVQTSLKNSQPEDKEVISLVLGQAFIHLSRSSVFVNERHPCQSVDDYVITEKLKVSVIPHIESLILFYDWRRLNDVTWFRKCWYHTSFVEALFIGRKPSEEPPVPHPSSPYHNSGDQPMWSPGSSVEESSTDPSTGDSGTNTITAEIVVAVSVADMRLAANVAQLMGNAYIQVSHLRGVAHADIKDNELVFMDVDGTLEDFEIDAQGGVVAGNVKVQDTAISLNSSSQTGCIPEHKASVTIHDISGHIDYMSARILLLKGTNVRVKVWDSWEGINQDHSEHTAAKIQVCCSFCWSTCQISIHGTTAKGMFGILQRIYDFIIQQKKRSERTIGSMIPAGTAASTIFANYQAEQKRAEKTREAEIQNPLLEHHHWMWAVKVGSIKLMNALGIQISADKHDVSLGGVINVSGDNLSVVCFHGTSFREKEWVVFNIDLITAMFSTLAIPGLGSSLFHQDDSNDNSLDKDSKRRICQQVCVLTLGDEETSTLSELAAIYHVTAGRGGVPPVSPKEISEWLNYVCINHYLNSIHKTLSKPVGYSKESQKLVIQPISCLPACRFKLVNDHLWPSLRQLEEQVMKGIMESATVECTLQTTFSGGIAVTTTVENYLFLHDLFLSYIDCINKQNVSFRPPFTAVSQSSLKTTKDDEDKSSNCLRRFVSVHWELEPRIVLLATAQWASGHFNPHITWVLEKLGFKHARTTIPKYIQRGLMDPLDLGIASIIELLIELSATKKLRTIDDNSV